MLRLKDWIILLKHLLSLTLCCSGIYYLLLNANKLVASNSNLGIAFGVFLFILSLFLCFVLISWLKDFWQFVCKLFRKLLNLYD